MTDDTQRVGLGKIIYSVENATAAVSPGDEKVDNAEVQEAAEESFPASDPPGYLGGAAPEPDCPPT